MSDKDKVKQLRQSTGAGFKDCSSALEESSGDIQKAVEILRVKGVSKASKKMARQANEGVVAVSGNSSKTSLIEVNCETDFVAKNEDFINFVKEISEINNECNSNLEKLNKTEMKNSKTVEDTIVGLIAKIGEKITVGRAKTLNSNGVKNYKYLHTIVKDNLSKLAVIVSLKSKSDSDELNLFGKQLSMHIAASNPISILPESIEKEIIEKEKELIMQELKSSGKPKDIVDKISIGKLNKFKEENSLMTQNWVMDPKKKVKDIIKEVNIPELKIEDFVRIKIGE
tara:strand:+ start:415 stop:1266 length:852 start_codon:yes stop_codon:yes gene_type:complete